MNQVGLLVSIHKCEKHFHRLYHTAERGKVKDNAMLLPCTEVVCSDDVKAHIPVVTVGKRLQLFHKLSGCCSPDNFVYLGVHRGASEYRGVVTSKWLV